MTDTPISDVSDTALWVAAFRALESKRPDALFHDSLADVLTGDRGRAIARAMPYPKILAWMMGVRTIAIDNLIFEAIAAGVDTVVNIGAGLDTRPYRLALPKDLRWIEIDFPHIIALKNTKLADEVPSCQLSRIALDLTNRSEARRVYAEIGSQAKSALIITEGVTIYLSIEEVRHLSADLREIPNFHYWIQDYRRFDKTLRSPKKLQKKLKSAPFRFQHPDPLGFFTGLGWKIRRDIKAMDEGERLGRPFPMSFPWNLLMVIIPKEKKEEMRKGMGYVLFEVDKGKGF